MDIGTLINTSISNASIYFTHYYFIENILIYILNVLTIFFYHFLMGHLVSSELLNGTRQSFHQTSIFCGHYLMLLAIPTNEECVCVRHVDYILCASMCPILQMTE